jgi:hypothetical protein
VRNTGIWGSWVDGYNRRPLLHLLDRSMEAERLNLIETNLADLARRFRELRGYL